MNESQEAHEKEDCKCPYEYDPKHISRAYWICPVCKRDVTMEYLLLYEANKQKDE